MIHVGLPSSGADAEPSREGLYAFRRRGGDMEAEAEAEAEAEVKVGPRVEYTTSEHHLAGRKMYM
jgi:hypothetical protein